MGEGSSRLYGRVIRGNNVLAPPEEGGRVERLGKAVGALPVRGDLDYTHPLMFIVMADIMNLIVEVFVSRRDSRVLAIGNRGGVVYPQAQPSFKSQA